MNSLICETSRIFRSKKREYLKEIIHDFETNRKNKNIGDQHRGINEFKKDYKPIPNSVTDDNDDLLADSQNNILKRWKDYFCQFLNLRGVNDVSQTEMHTANPLIFYRLRSVL